MSDRVGQWALGTGQEWAGPGRAAQDRSGQVGKCRTVPDMVEQDRAGPFKGRLVANRAGQDLADSAEPDREKGHRKADDDDWVLGLVDCKGHFAAP